MHALYRLILWCILTRGQCLFPAAATPGAVTYVYRSIHDDVELWLVRLALAQYTTHQLRLYIFSMSLYTLQVTNMCVNEEHLIDVPSYNNMLAMNYRSSKRRQKRETTIIYWKWKYRLETRSSSGYRSTQYLNVQENDWSWHKKIFEHLAMRTITSKQAGKIQNTVMIYHWNIA